MKIKAVAALIAATAIIAGTANIAVGQGSKVRVDDVGRARVERFLVWSLEAPAAPGAVVSPETCQQESPRRDKVWFLPVFIASGTADVTCAVPARSDLVLNLGGTICLEDEVTPRDSLVECATQGEVDIPTVQTAIVDGKTTDEFATDATRVFTANLPADNGFGLPAGPRVAAYAGRNLLIQGLDKGEHTIRLIFRLPPSSEVQFDVDITYHVTVG